jgi:hypothetical protein
MDSWNEGNRHKTDILKQGVLERTCTARFSAAKASSPVNIIIK